MAADAEVPCRSISVVIPARNEEACVLRAVDSAASALDALSADFEIIVVDDGSTDRTWHVLESARRKRPWLIAVRMSEATGKGAALDEGFRSTSKSTVAFVDADAQIPRPEIEKFLAEVTAASSTVLVGRRLGRRMVLSRRAITAIYRLLAGTLLGITVTDPGCPLKAFPSALLRGRPLVTRGWVIDAELLLRAATDGLQIREIPVAVETESAESNFRFFDLVDCVRELWVLRPHARAGEVAR